MGIQDFPLVPVVFWYQGIKYEVQVPQQHLWPLYVRLPDGHILRIRKNASIDEMTPSQEEAWQDISYSLKVYDALAQEPGVAAPPAEQHYMLVQALQDALLVRRVAKDLYNVSRVQDQALHGLGLLVRDEMDALVEGYVRLFSVDSAESMADSLDVMAGLWVKQF